MNTMPIARFDGSSLSHVNDVDELSDADLFSDHKAKKQFDHIYAELRKDVENLGRTAASRYGRQRIQEFLDLLDSAMSDASVDAWGKLIDDAYQERMK